MHQNFLLGHGERLTEEIYIASGGGQKEPPYTFRESVNRLSTMLDFAVSEIDNLPSDACPRDEAIISLTLHPEYIAKSYFPKALMSNVGMTVVGSRPKKITPKKLSHEREPVEVVTTELLARGARSALRSWNLTLPDWNERVHGAKDLVSIEEIFAPAPHHKLKGKISDSGIQTMEVVLHADESDSGFRVLEEFRRFLQVRKLSEGFERYFFAQGLCFIELDALAERSEEIATFSTVRALRKMPELRILRPTIRSAGIPTKRPDLPSGPPISNDVSVAIFDGGIPENHPITKWVKLYEFPDILPANSELQDHGVAVSSAMLFGHINPNEALPRPYCIIDHYRVLDKESNVNPHELYDVLERIKSVLLEVEYDFINLSIGPHLPIEDDEVHAWTAVLDDHLSRSHTLAAIAVGNNGESDQLSGLNRVQVPADCVNALAVGACDTTDHNWQRAPYSSIGPGRSPGLVKPDIMSFGGSSAHPFVVLSNDDKPNLSEATGTSFAAPSVIRIASGIRAHFRDSLNDLAIRALLIHTAEESNHDPLHVGWGRSPQNINDIVFCDNDTVRVVYQGDISPASYIRAAIPLPQGDIEGMVTIKATVCYKSQTDPHHPGNYTRAGLEVIFRPNAERFSREEQSHPDTKQFFGSSRIGANEIELRRDAWKWENCLHAKKRMRGRSLNNPCFDIHYNSRLEGRNFKPGDKLPYALVVSVSAASVVNLYDQVVRTYANILEPLRPVLELPISNLEVQD